MHAGLGDDSTDPARSADSTPTKWSEEAMVLPNAPRRTLYRSHQDYKICLPELVSLYLLKPSSLLSLLAI